MEILQNDKLTEAEKKVAIKRKVKLEFKYLKQPTEWLQAPDWPFFNGIPLVFIGTLEEGREPGHARTYVFYCEANGTYTFVKQCD